ncbi:menaquinol-cytochrome c reductase cytochrome b/c subunit [Geomicrobium sp. JCM 19055]|uniref:menaquinol-cytochrome c reductase cytochrome b/c subunit n=1 Tax=Geomicrobium sp. JCM 19055 TaxID=1460649 RepID=UPI00045EDA61|nr:menaquinol-cytochrome c reductase cytochrome b/c subunit [Geomicrobium sp. JCM 19055]GAJ98762.1 menaquinone-cytochrome c oxidoreductase, cytochrome c subunit [Geomicrobium sp. JCM 19055]
MKRGKGMKFVGDSRIPAREHRMNNTPKDYSEYPGKTEAFFPNYLLKEWLVGAVFLIGFLCLTVAHPAPLEQPADPNATGYIPVPDWFFLFLYQLLKYPAAAGNLTILGTVVIPGLAFGALLLAPWLDKGPERRLSKRPIATGMMLLGFMSVAYLTWEAGDQHEWGGAASIDDDVREIDTSHQGYDMYVEESCISCHGDNMEGTAMGPDLYDLGYDAEGIAQIAVEGIGEMPPIYDLEDGSEEELLILAEYVLEEGSSEEGAETDDEESEEGAEEENGEDAEEDEEADA